MESTVDEYGACSVIPRRARSLEEDASGPSAGKILARKACRLLQCILRSSLPEVVIWGARAGSVA